MLPGATKDRQTATSKGALLREFLQGVELKEISNIITRNGITTELFRPEWNLGPGKVEHMIHVILRGSSISAWHMHEKQTDNIFVTDGSLKIVLFDGREDSPSHGKLNIFHMSRLRPGILSIPPGIWHGIQNLEGNESSFINYFDHAYCYEDPDEWRLPMDSDQIPYRF